MSSSGVIDSRGSFALSPRWDSIVRNYPTFGITEVLSKGLLFVLIVYPARMIVDRDLRGSLAYARCHDARGDIVGFPPVATCLIKKIAQAPRAGSVDALVAFVVRMGLTVGWTTLALLYVHAVDAKPVMTLFVLVVGTALTVGAYFGVVGCVLRAFNTPTRSSGLFPPSSIPPRG